MTGAAARRRGDSRDQRRGERTLEEAMDGSLEERPNRGKAG